MYPFIAGWSSLVARRAHNPKVVGSNPAPATKTNTRTYIVLGVGPFLSLGYFWATDCDTFCCLIMTSCASK
jgi:hypothetical protein